MGQVRGRQAGRWPRVRRFRCRFSSCLLNLTLSIPSPRLLRPPPPPSAPPLPFSISLLIFRPPPPSSPVLSLSVLRLPPSARHPHISRRERQCSSGAAANNSRTRIWTLTPTRNRNLTCECSQGPQDDSRGGGGGGKGPSRGDNDDRRGGMPLLCVSHFACGVHRMQSFLHCCEEHHILLQL